MAATTKLPVTPAMLERWMDEHGDALVEQLNRAEQRAAEVRAAVDQYIEPIFHTFGFRNCRTGEPITHSKYLYLTGTVQDDLCDQYYAACDVAHREHGHDLPAGHCPALIAESEQIEAESALIDSVGKLMGFENVYGEHRKQLFRILRDMYAARQKHNRRLRRLVRKPA